MLKRFLAQDCCSTLTFGDGTKTPWVLYVGLTFFTLAISWFRTTIRENLQGMNSGQLKHSYVLGMFWFIFSEVMFFAAFFGALFYVRQLAGPWLAGEGEGGRMNGLLWPGYEAAWPPASTPQEVVGGVNDQLIANNGEYTSAQQSMSFAEAIIGMLVAAVEYHHSPVVQLHCAHRPHGDTGW